MSIKLFSAILFGSSLLSVPVQAMTAQQSVEREIVVQNEDGTETVKRETADMVTPGEKIVYSLNYFNDQDKAAENIVLVMPVPAELALIEGSAELSNAGTTYSVDDGVSFANRQDLQITLQSGDLRPAQASDITHVRWVVPAVMPGASGTLSFKGLLK